MARRVVVAVLISVLVLSLAYIAWRGVHVLLEAFAGVLFAVFLAALSEWLSKWTGISYGKSLVIVILGLLLVSAGLGWLLANRVAVQISELWQNLPKSLERIEDYLRAYPWGQQLLDNMPFSAQAASPLYTLSHVTDVVSGVARFFEAFLVIFLVGIFGAAEADLYRQGILHLVPYRHRPRANEAISAINFNLRWWLVGQIFLMFVIGITTTLGLWLIGIPLPLALGVIAGVMEMVPYIGPWISVVPAAMIALLVSPWHLLAVAGLYLFLHILEGYVLFPLVQRKAVLLPPALTLVAQFLLGELLGFLGLFVAAPLTVAAVVLVKMLYVEDTLGDEDVEVPGEPGNPPRREAG
jgi:predicted PurR-regulated permease PerM